MINKIIKYLKTHNYEAYICGGTARDLYLNKTLINYDVAIIATLQELKETFKEKIVELDPYNTSITINYLGVNFNLYPLKKVWLENTYYKFDYTKSLKEDSNSRDFTINALYYNPLKNKWHDFHGGLSDIQNKIIKFVGNPYDRILESKVRILRAPILAGILGNGWKISDGTQKAIKDYRLKLELAHSQQIYKEIEKIFNRVETPSKVFNLLRNSKILDSFFPELTLCVGIEQSNKRKNLDLFQHIMYAIDSIKLSHPRRDVLRAAALLHDIGKPQCLTYNNENKIHFYGHEKAGTFISERILFRWGFKKSFVKKVSSLISLHLFDASKRASVSSIRKLINKAGSENIHNLLDLRVADRYGTGRKNISMDKIEFMRDRINKELEKINPEQFKLILTDKQIISIIKNDTDDAGAVLQYIKQYLKNKILYEKIKNKPDNLRRLIKNTLKINCPLDKTHLFKTWVDIQENNADTFENGKLKCGVFCNFICDKKLRSRTW
jgi:tRNA nucleotidyltransferase (CCA-adding enzyme)